MPKTRVEQQTGTWLSHIPFRPRYNDMRSRESCKTRLRSAVVMTCRLSRDLLIVVLTNTSICLLFAAGPKLSTVQLCPRWRHNRFTHNNRMGHVSLYIVDPHTPLLWVLTYNRLQEPNYSAIIMTQVTNDIKPNPAVTRCDLTQCIF